MTNKILKCHDDVMKRVEASNARVNEVESLTKGVPALVETVQAKLSESSEKLKKYRL